PGEERTAPPATDASAFEQAGERSNADVRNRRIFWRVGIPTQSEPEVPRVLRTLTNPLAGWTMTAGENPVPDAERLVNYANNGSLGLFGHPASRYRPARDKTRR